jgi:hypothetical protein
MAIFHSYVKLPEGNNYDHNKRIIIYMWNLDMEWGDG